MHDINVFTTNDFAETSQSTENVASFLEQSMDLARGWDELLAMLDAEEIVHQDSDLTRRYSAGEGLYRAMHAWIVDPDNADILIDMHQDGVTLELPVRN